MTDKTMMGATCPACDGTGSVPEDGILGAPADDCERCGGTGEVQVTEFQAMVLMLNDRVLDLERELVALEREVGSLRQDRADPIVVQIETLRVQPNENLIIRLDPKLEEDMPGFHADLQTALVQSGLGGRVFVLALEPRHADVVVVPREL